MEFRRKDGEILTECITDNHKITIFENKKYRWMVFGHRCIQTIIHKKKLHLPILTYIKAMTFLIPYFSTNNNVLLLGMGGGAIIHYLSHIQPKIKITAIEIDEQVINIAKDYFFIKEQNNLSIINDSAENYLANTTIQFNTILIDLYHADGYPDSCKTSQFFMNCKKVINSNGVIVFNIASQNIQEISSFINLIHQYLNSNTLSIFIDKTANTLVYITFDDNFFEILCTIKNEKKISNLSWIEGIGYSTYI